MDQVGLKIQEVKTLVDPIVQNLSEFRTQYEQLQDIRFQLDDAETIPDSYNHLVDVIWELEYFIQDLEALDNAIGSNE